MPYNFSSGHYNASWNSVYIGTTRDGFTIREEFHNQKITVDETGDVVVDGVLRGCSTTVRLDYAEYTLVKAALYGQSNGAQGSATGAGATGGLMSQFARPLVLTPAGGNSLTGSTPYTFPLALIDGDFDIMLKTKLREGPIEFFILPNSSSGVMYTPGQ